MSWMRSLKEFIGIHKPSVLELLEPEVSGTQADNICNKIEYDEWARVEAVGFNGGIWIFWRKDCEVTIKASHPQFLLLKSGKGPEIMVLLRWFMRAQCMISEKSCGWIWSLTGIILRVRGSLFGTSMLCYARRK